MSNFDTSLPHSRATPGRNKRGARRIDFNGYHFDSQSEMRRYKVLRQWEEIGVIKDLCLAHKVIGTKDRVKAAKHRWVLQEGFTDAQENRIRPIMYTDDFQYVVHEVLVVEDWKGWLAPVDKRTHKLFRHKYPHIHFFVNQEVTKLYDPTIPN